MLLGVKLESPEGIANCEAILAVPGLGFAELGPGDLGLSLGYVAVPREPYPAEMREARERVFAACRKNRIAFLETGSPENIAAKLDEGVRVIAGHREETAKHRPRPPAPHDARLSLRQSARGSFCAPALSGRRRTAETRLSRPVSCILLDLGGAFVQGNTILVPAHFR